MARVEEIAGNIRTKPQVRGYQIAGQSKRARSGYLVTGSSARRLKVAYAPGESVVVVPTNEAAEKEIRSLTSFKEKHNPVRVLLYGAVSEGTHSRFESEVYAPSARARALLRGRQIAKNDLEAAGGAYDLAEVQTMLNDVSRQAIEKRVKEGSLLAVPGPNNRRRYPVMQFTQEGLVPGIKDVQKALPTCNPWAVLNFFVHPDVHLDGQKPIDVLRKGKVDLVIAAAKSMGLQGG